MGVGTLDGPCGVEWRASLHDWLHGGDPVVHRHKAISHNTACMYKDAVGLCRYVGSDEQLRERKPHRENVTARCTCQC